MPCLYNTFNGILKKDYELCKGISIIILVKTWAFSQYNEASYDALQIGAKQIASESEYDALVDFYNNLNGPLWRINRNWLNGDPCQVYCINNKE
jgi:hypothetical protein